MALSREDILRLAELGRLELSEEEIARAEHDLDAILGYVNHLQTIDTEGVHPWAMPAIAQGFRPDDARVIDERTRELIISNFPAREGDLLMTPGVFARPKGSS